MIDEPPSRDDCSDDLLLDVVETLDACGLSREPYRLQDYVDVDALEQLISNSDGDVEVDVTVEGVTLSVSEGGVHVLNVR